MPVSCEDGSLAYDGLRHRLHDRLEEAGVRLLGIRHGQTHANRQAEETGVPLICGRSESPLTDQGWDQARQAAEALVEELGGEEWLSRVRRDPELLPVVYTSPLERARDTAGCFLDLVRSRTGLGLAPRVDERLSEFDFGDYEMRPVPELVADEPVLARNWDSYKGEGVDFLHRFPSGESRSDVAVRVSQLLKDVAERHQGRTVLLFCHQETLVATRTVLGLSRTQDGKVRADAASIKNAVPYCLTEGRGQAPAQEWLLSA